MRIAQEQRRQRRRQLHRKPTNDSNTASGQDGREPNRNNRDDSHQESPPGSGMFRDRTNRIDVYGNGTQVPKSSPRRDKLWRQFNDHRRSNALSMLSTPSLKHSHNPGHGHLIQPDVEQTPGETDPKSLSPSIISSSSAGRRNMLYSRNNVNSSPSIPNIRMNSSSARIQSHDHDRKNHSNHIRKDNFNKSNVHTKNRKSITLKNDDKMNMERKKWLSSAQSSAEWSDASELQDSNDVQEHEHDANDRMQRRRSLHRARKQIEARKRATNVQKQNDQYEHSTRSVSHDHSNYNSPDQYSNMRLRQIESYPIDIDNPPPIISKASTGNTSQHQHQHQHHQAHKNNRQSFDSYESHSNLHSRNSNHSTALSYSKADENIRSSNTNQHPYSSKFSSHQSPYHYHSKDDATFATADNTVATEESGGIRLARHQDEHIHETYRNSTSMRYTSSTNKPHTIESMDFDDETTVFDANTVNTAEDDEQRRLQRQNNVQQKKMQDRHHLQTDTYRFDGYSSLGISSDAMRLSLSTSTKDSNYDINVPLSQNINRNGGNSGIPPVASNSNSKQSIEQEVSKSPTSTDSEEGTQLTFDEEDARSGPNSKIKHDKLSYETKLSQTKSKPDLQSNEDIEDKNMRMAAGFTAAVVAGAIAIGPASLIIGAVSLGCVGGYYQIPESKRTKITSRAESAFAKATNSALKSSERLSNSCVTAFEKTGMEAPKGCLERAEEEERSGPTVQAPSWLVHQFDLGEDGTDANETKKDKEDDGEDETEADGLLGNLGGVIGGVAGDGGNKMERRRTVACLRQTRITPINQIHALKPSSQPRAWLDVMASTLTSIDEKNEAMEEILILVKNKNHAQMFLDEGILDSLMYILSTSFQKLPPPLPDTPEFNDSKLLQKQSSIPHNNKTFVHAKLAANCCVALGKAHCAVVHTEGDLLLMSAYNRGSVPVERQLAQMLHEVPHHSRMMGTNMGGMLEDNMQEEFVLTEMSLQQAEEMAKNIRALMEGRLDWNC